MSRADEHLTDLRRALSEGDLETAYQVLVKIAHDPASDAGAAHGMAGTLAFDLGRREASRNHLERADDMGACDSEASARLALLVASEDATRALALLERHQAGLPTWVEPLHARLLLVERGDSDGALDHLMAALGDLPEGERATWLPEAAYLACRAESLDGALEVASLCHAALDLERRSEVLDALLHLASWGDMATERLGEAVDALLTRVEPSLASSDERFRFAMARARRLLGCFAPADAHRWARRALEERPDDPGAGLFALEVQILSGDVDGALGEVADRTRDEGIREAAWLGLADLLRRQDRHDEAADLLEAVLEDRPMLAGLWVELSRFLADLGRDEDAVEAFSQAMALEPDIDSQATRLHAGVRQIVDGLPALFQTACGREPTVVHTLRFGHNAVVARVEAGDEHWYAKVFLPGRRSQVQVAETSALMARLGERLEGLAVPRPATTEPLSCSALPAMVMTRIPGGSLRRTLTHPRSTMAPAHAAAVGEAL
ncbi:MAG: tetratricopeptide repeat protein, partial [Myxococcota bacterium]|nr:tetratricopeptide repeat protein [Myxococcota bacterium]